MDAAAYEEMRAIEDHHWWFRGRKRVLAPLITRALREAPPGPLLDLGCGTGGNLTVLGPLAGARPSLGLDVEPAAVLHAARRGLPWLVCAESGRLPVRDAGLGCITALDVLEHCEDDAAVLRECARALAPGGRLVASVPAYPGLWSRHDVALHHVRRYAAGELELRLTEAGFEVERSHGFNFLLLPLVALVRRFRKPADTTETETDFFRLPVPLDALIASLFWIERALLVLVPVPFGLSFMVRARKPDRPP